MISQEAAYWYLRCSDEPVMRRSDRKKLLKWLKRSPENVAEMLRMCDLDGQFGRQRLLDAVNEIGDTNVVEGHFGGGASQYDYQPSKTVSAKVKRKADTKLRWKIAAAVSTLTATALLGLATFDRPVGVVETVASEWQHKTLDDGSSIHLDARTQVKVEFTPGQRIVHLHHGQAAFDVAKDVRRPFIVRTPVADIIAVGTRFSVDVDMKAGITTIVEEGVVKVIRHGETDSSAMMLTRDEKLHLAPSYDIEAGGVIEPQKIQVDAKADLEWTTGWVHFEDGATVGEMARQFNRRHATQVIIEDPAVADKQVRYARMRIDSVKDFKEAMESQEGVAVSEDREHKTLRLLPE